MRRPTRPGPREAAVLIAVLCLACGAWLGWTALQAKAALEAAREELTKARTALLQRDLLTARTAISAAAANTEEAREATGGPVWRLATALPGDLDNSLRVIRSLAAAADELAVDALPSALTGADALDPSQVRTVDGTFDVTAIRRATSPVRTAAASAQQVRTQVAALPDVLLPRPIRDARAQLAGQTETLAAVLQGSARALEVAPALLGEDRQRRYLLLVQQNAESRGTGGLPGGFAVVEAASGRVRVTATGSRRELQDGPVRVPPGVPEDFVVRYRQYGSFNLLVNINMSPDLPVVARLVAERWRAATGQDLDGVIAADAQALADILAGSGPIDVDGRLIPPEGLVDYLAVGQYADFTAPTDGSALDLTQQRQDALSEVAKATAARLTAGGGDTAALLVGLGRALSSGHLRMTSDDPALEPALREGGVDGALPRVDRPLAYPVVWNAVGGKLDTFLDRSVRYEAGDCAADTRRSTVSVSLTNNAPREGLPPYVRIFLSPTGNRLSTDNEVVLSVYLTRGAEVLSATLDGIPLDPSSPGQPLLSAFEEAGLPGRQLLLFLPNGQTRTLRLEVEEPVVPGAALVPEQPLARPLERRIDVPSC